MARVDSQENATSTKVPVPVERSTTLKREKHDRKSEDRKMTDEELQVQIGKLVQ